MAVKKRIKTELSYNRQSAIEQGAYDGRFRSQVIPNKKRKNNRHKTKAFLKQGNFDLP